MKAELFRYVFSTNYIQSRHIAIIRKAKKLGKLIFDVLSDESYAIYKRHLHMSFEERKFMIENNVGVNKVVKQNSISYSDNLRSLKPNYVVHEDDWKRRVQRPIKDEVVSV